MLGMYGLGTQELIIAGVVLVVLVLAPFLFAVARAGFRHPLLTAIAVSIAVFLVVALAAGFTGVNALAILAIIAIAAIVYGFSRSVTRTSDNKSDAASRKASSAKNEASTLDEAQPTDLSKAVSGQVAEKASVEIPLSPSTSGPYQTAAVVGRLFARGREACAKRPEILELAAFFAMVGSLMLIGVLFQGIITPPQQETVVERIRRLGRESAAPSEGGAGIGQIDEREQDIIDRHKGEGHRGSLWEGIGQARAEREIETRRQQRAYAEQAPPEVAEPVKEMLSNLGNRRQVLGILRQMTPEQREEALRVAPGVGQQMGDDRVVVFARCVGAFSRGVTHGWVNPIMELVGIGGTEKEIQFIRQLDEIAAQEFHPYRPGDPWSERVPLQAIEMLPWIFVIGGLIFIAYRWKARSAQMKLVPRRDLRAESKDKPGKEFPVILLIPVCIATMGILVLIAVMSGTFHTEQTSPKNDRIAERLADQIEADEPPVGFSPETMVDRENDDLALREMKAAQDSLERMEAIDTSPKSKSAAGEAEKFMKEFVNQSVSQHKEYLAELDEIGWDRILDLERLARDTALSESKVTIREAKEIVDKYSEQMNLLLAKSRKEINALNLSAVEKAEAKQAFDRGMLESRHHRDQIWELEREIVSEFGDIIDFLYRDYGNWSVSDGQLLFSTDEKATAYNSYLASIDNLVAEQEQLRRSGAQKVQAGLDRLRP